MREELARTARSMAACVAGSSALRHDDLQLSASSPAGHFSFEQVDRPGRRRSSRGTSRSRSARGGAAGPATASTSRTARPTDERERSADASRPRTTDRPQRRSPPAGRGRGSGRRSRFDAVAEDRQHRRQERQRADDRDRGRPRSCRSPSSGTGCRRAGTGRRSRTSRRARRRTRPDRPSPRRPGSRRASTRPAAPLGPVAGDHEQRVVDRHGQPDQDDELARVRADRRRRPGCRARGRRTPRAARSPPGPAGRSRRRPRRTRSSRIRKVSGIVSRSDASRPPLTSSWMSSFASVPSSEWMRRSGCAARSSSRNGRHRGEALRRASAPSPGTSAAIRTVVPVGRDEAGLGRGEARIDDLREDCRRRVRRRRPSASPSGRGRRRAPCRRRRVVDRSDRIADEQVTVTVRPAAAYRTRRTRRMPGRLERRLLLAVVARPRRPSGCRRRRCSPRTGRSSAPSRARTTGQRWRARPGGDSDGPRRAGRGVGHGVMPPRATSDPLDGHRDRAAAAEAQRREPVAALAPRELVEQRRDDPRAAGPDRVAERDRAAVDVDLVPVEPERAAVGQGLGGERLVDLDEVERLDAAARSGRAAGGRPRPGRGTATSGRPRPGRSRRSGRGA